VRAKVWENARRAAVRRDDQGLTASRSIGAWVGDLRAQEGPLIFARANAA